MLLNPCADTSTLPKRSSVHITTIVKRLANVVESSAESNAKAGLETVFHLYK